MSQMEVLNNKISHLIKKAKTAKNLQSADLAALVRIPVSMMQKIETHPCHVQARLLFKTICVLQLEECAIYLTAKYGVKKFVELDL